MNKITCNLATVLSKQKMTQTELAKRTGLTGKSVYTYCSRRSFPTAANMQAISAVLGVSTDEIWPHYVEEKKALYHRRKESIRKAISARHDRADNKWPSRQPEYKADKHAKSDLRKVRAAAPVDPDAPNAVPLADDARGGDFHLRPAKTSEDDLQDPRWCRAHARALHKFLVDHCAWGVYHELRTIMAVENRLTDERARVAQGRE